MYPKTRFILVVVAAVLVTVGVLVLLLITTTPRSIEYTYSLTGTSSETLLGYLQDMTPPKNQTTESLYDVLYQFGVIRTAEDVEDSDFDIYPYQALSSFTDDPGAVPVTMLYQIDPEEVASTRQYMQYQEMGKRVLYFMEDPDFAEQIQITAYNYNLRSRQVAIFIFYQDAKGALSGYVLNDVWLRPRQYTLIYLLASPNSQPVLITDLDNNQYLITQE
ncbi:hypothetical protein NEHOM01_1513 [Nematocida homosporus]|uniref:uncharacterized protein n=1 Tax=Nematocida homosporus TaxID=1912981 RepID=UPI002221101B|nr:uncharacterized protein NEHOM01_1513 [Nematocida homosporus]KAI5186513.1 hypothetical protein NEHOM01_1513 [Nematocida homosporus]